MVLGGTACQYIKVHLVFKQNLSSSNFFFLISVKTRFDIEEYSFGQTTLEQVFIKFAKDQEIEEEEDIEDERL